MEFEMISQEKEEEELILVKPKNSVAKKSYFNNKNYFSAIVSDGLSEDELSQEEEFEVK